MALVGAVASDGGVPIVVNGKTIGAIGSSGGADDDIHNNDTQIGLPGGAAPPPHCDSRPQSRDQG